MGIGIGNLAAIINKARLITCTSNDFQLTDSQIIDYINSFYLFDFPAQFRSLKLKDIYTFNTVRGVDVYPFDSEHFSTVEAPAMCMKRHIKLFQEPWSFYRANYNWQYCNNFTFGNGGTGPYTGFASPAGNTNPNLIIIRSQNNNPMVQSPLNSTQVFPAGVPVPFPQTNISRVQNILITTFDINGNTINVTDDGEGNLIGQQVATPSTISYTTGAITLNFTVGILAGTPIQIQYNPSQMTIPLSILFYQNQFTLRPVPIGGFTIEIVAYRLPSQVLLGTLNDDVPNYAGVPEQAEWWETLAYGAAKKIFEDRLDSDGVQFCDKGLAERYTLNYTRTYAQIGTQRIQTIFSDQLTHNYDGGGWGWGSGGGF
jgi:hypothetical protein